MQAKATQMEWISPSNHCQEVEHQKIAQAPNNNTMAYELIVDFPEHSHRYYMMCHQDLKCACEYKNHAVSQGSSPHQDQTSSLGHSQERCHRHRQPKMSILRSSSESWKNDSSNAGGRSGSGPSLAGAERSVRIAETSLLKFVAKLEDREDVDRQDLWYSKADLKLMKLAALKDVLEVRGRVASGVPLGYFLKENDDSIVCLMGIEDHCSNAHVKAKARRERCVHAVLQEQRRQQMMNTSSPLTDWQRQDLIAHASFSQTKNAATRARQLGLLHQA